MKIYPVFIPHAGCPHRCLFCAQDRSTSHADVPSAEAVGTWLETVLPEQGDGEIAFYGGTFTSLPEEQQTLYLDRPLVMFPLVGFQGYGFQLDRTPWMPKP